MLLPRNLSSRLLLALSLTAPSILLSTLAKAQTVVPPRAVEVNPTQPTVQFSPNLDSKLRVLQPGNAVNNGVFVEEHGPSWVEYKEHKGKLDRLFDPALQTNPVVRPSAVDTLNKLRVNP
jgi:hypothetical protein